MRLFTCFSLLLLYFRLCAQVPVQWFAEGAHWSFSTFSIGNEGYQVAKTIGSETIAGQVCKVIEVQNTIHDFISNNTTTTTKEEYAFERNDSVFQWSLNKFVLRYDFTKKVGDTLDFLGVFPGQYAIVGRVGDTILWNQIKVEFQEGWQFQDLGGGKTDTIKAIIYKGIGGRFFLDYVFYDPSWLDAHSALECFRDDVHPNPTCFLDDLDYQSFPNKKAVWREEQSIWCWFSGLEYVLEPSNSDTQDLSFRPTYYGSYPCPQPTLTAVQKTPEHWGIIWQQPFERKVYAKRLLPDSLAMQDQNYVLADFPLNKSVLLYDFDLKVGQQLDWKPLPNTVTAIDTVFLATGTPRRRFKFESIDPPFTPEPHYWIEGIGSTLGLFGSYRQGFTDSQSDLYCYELEDTLQYNKFDSKTCDSLHKLPVWIPKFHPDELLVFPQPSTDFFTLALPEYWLPARLFLMDIAGNLIADMGKIQSTQQQFYLPERLSAGFYHLKVSLENGATALKKMIKI